MTVMKRIPEPELMETDHQAKAYSQADFDAPHSMFVDLFVERFGSDISGHVLDAGCGPADIAVRFARQCTNCMVHGVDASEAMIHYGNQHIRNNGFEDRIQLYQGYLPDVELPAASFDAIIVNSLLHHLPDPGIMWDIIRQYARGGSDAPVFVMDLIRPASIEDAAALVEMYCGDEAEVLKTDFYNSLLAAYRPDEIMIQLSEAGLDFLKLEVVSDRHFIVWGRMK